MKSGNLHLVVGSPVPDGPSVAGESPCRRPGCEGRADSTLGFCVVCLGFYDAANARRGRFVELVCTRLISIGDPLFAVFGSSRPRAFGAHVAAHLVESEAQRVHVPTSAVRDFFDELDEGARGAG